MTASFGFSVSASLVTSSSLSPPAFFSSSLSSVSSSSFYPQIFISKTIPFKFSQLSTSDESDAFTLLSSSSSSFFIISSN
jgi:hypothetical protein